MTVFEYKVIPAPVRGLKAKGIKGTPERFANALQTVMNELGAVGWDYQRMDTLPVEERVGLTGKTTKFQNMLVFRRAVEVEVERASDVAALIEDQSEILEKNSDITQTAPATDVMVHASPTVDPAAANEPIGDAPQAPVGAADKRVNDTLGSAFVFPWNKRTSAGSKPKERGKVADISAES